MERPEREESKKKKKKKEKKHRDVRTKLAPNALSSLADEREHACVQETNASPVAQCRRRARDECEH